MYLCRQAFSESYRPHLHLLNSSPRKNICPLCPASKLKKCVNFRCTQFRKFFVGMSFVCIL